MTRRYIYLGLVLVALAAGYFGLLPRNKVELMRLLGKQEPKYVVRKLSTQDIVRVCIQDGLVWSAESEGECGKPDLLPLLVDLRRPCNGVPSGKCDPHKRVDDTCLVGSKLYVCTPTLLTDEFEWALWDPPRDSGRATTTGPNSPAITGGGNVVITYPKGSK